MEIEFRPIDLDSDFEKCISFREDAYLCSFGSLVGFDRLISGYKERVACRLKSDDWFYLHIWSGAEIIGQLEFKSFSEEPDLGYVHLIHVAESHRGRGVADLAQAFIKNALAEAGCHGALLSVSRINVRAIKHYEKHAWQYLKANPKHELTDFYLRRFD